MRGHKMPRLDGTGRMGEGAGTGRKMGICSKAARKPCNVQPERIAQNKENFVEINNRTPRSINKDAGKALDINV